MEKTRAGRPCHLLQVHRHDDVQEVRPAAEQAGAVGSRQFQGDLVAAMGAFMFNPTPEQAAESMQTMQTINADYWASK